MRSATTRARLEFHCRERKLPRVIREVEAIKRRAHDDGSEYDLLQWGRLTMEAERVKLMGPDGKIYRLQWGRLTMEAESKTVRAIRSEASELQWGRLTMEAESTATNLRELFDALLQWGRLTMEAERG